MPGLTRPVESAYADFEDGMASSNGLIDFFLHPTYAQLQSSTTVPTTLTNPFTGGGVIIPSAGISTAFGLAWQVVTDPPHAGRNNGALLEYSDRVLQLACEYTLHDGSLVFTQLLETQIETGIYIFEQLLPTQVLYFVFPGFAVDFTWLIGI
jgi:hypothetical protein